MRNYPIHHIDSFTNVRFGGNPTVTVLQADTLTDLEMSQIAREMNLSETGFILKSIKDDFKLRFFTKAGDEINFCGHATVGALCSLAWGLKAQHNSLVKKLRVETNVGTLNMEIDLTKATPRFIFDSPKIALVPATYTHRQIADGLGMRIDLMDQTKPVMLETTNNYIFFAARDLTALEEMSIDMTKAYSFAKRDQRFVYCALTTETFDPKHQLHARAFVPLLGIPEDPFTGSMQGGLAAYALHHHMIPVNATWITTEQGHFLERPGKVDLEILNGDGLHVRLHAEAVHLFEGVLTL